ncbi:MAG: OmpA family protein, partial [Gammaproteobacteria bacterium]|nr:OmpA family protein [Gammaproteobacteria bacterium]
MKTIIRATYLAAAAASLLAVSQAQAAEGYWNAKGDSVWRSGSGECLHTGFWQPAMAIIGCDGKVAEVAAPEPMPAPAPAPAMSTADATVNFGFDRADLDAAATAAIDTLVGQAKSKGSIKSVRVTGHADRIGTEEYNLDLSLRRAGAVGDYLTRNAGIDAQSIELAGKGESQPLVGCEAVRGAALINCLAPNRRVEVVLDLF